MAKALVSTAIIFGITLLCFPTVSYAIRCAGLSDVQGQTCDETLHFANFDYSQHTGLTDLKIGSLGGFVSVGPGQTLLFDLNLVFTVSYSGAPASGAEILLFYSASNTPVGIKGVTLFNGGTNVTIEEVVCDQMFTNGACLGNTFADFTVGSQGFHRQLFSDFEDVSVKHVTVFIKKDFQFATCPTDAPCASISTFTNGHTVPEPSTWLLLGSGLLGLVLWGRRTFPRARSTSLARRRVL